MSKSEKKIKTNLQKYILALILLLLTNILTSYTLSHLAHEKLHEQVEKRMFDIANTAADGVDADFLATYQGTEEEKQTEGYQYSMFVLDTIYENIDLSYIYCVRCEGGDKFIFTLDPDKEAPAEYGSEIVVTESLRKAQQGTPAIDEEPHSDEWGTFYTAYSPVLDSNGNVASVIGVDFDANQHDKIINSFIFTASILTGIAIAIGLILAVFIMMQNKKRMSQVMENVEKLDREMEKLDSIILESSIKKLEMLPDNESAVLKTLASGEAENESALSEYDVLNTGVDSVYSKLKRYLRFIDKDMYIDDTTGANNKAAYKRKIKELDESITAGNARFSVAYFDINGIKSLYVHYGFEVGEQQMFECSKILKHIFGKESTYHITGDEFIILADDKFKLDMEELFVKFDEELKKYNSEHIQDHIMSVAKGFSTYHAEKYSNYRSVFIEAKEKCDKDKESYYRVEEY